MGKMATGLAVGVGAGVGLAAVNAFRNAFGAVKREFADQLSQIDEIGKFSDRLGITTENLAALQLQAGLAGVSTKELNTSLRTMLKNVGEAANGTGDAAIELRRLGIDAKKLAQFETGDQFKIIAERISQIPTAAGKAAAAYKILGRSGVQMISAMKDGAEGVEAARKRASQLGLSLSREEANRVEMANDAMLEFKSTIAGMARTFMIELAPALQAGARMLTEMNTEGKGTGSTIAKIADVGIRGFAGLLNIFSTANRFLLGLRIAATRASAAFVALAEHTTRAAGGAGAAKRLEQIKEELTSTADRLEKTMRKPKMGDTLLRYIDDVKARAKATGDAWSHAGRQVEAGVSQMTAAAGVGLGAGGTAGGRPGDDTGTIMENIYQQARRMAEQDDFAGLDRLRQQISNWEDPLRRNLMALRAVKMAFREVNAEAGRKIIAAQAEEGRRLWEQTRTPLEKMRIEYDNLKKLLDQGDISRDTANRRLAQLREQYLGGEDATAQTGSLARTTLTRGVAGGANKRERMDKKKVKALEEIEKNTREKPAAKAG